jgi:hypothetical protein
MSRTTLYRLFHRDGGVAAFIQLVNNHAYQETTGHVLQLGLAGVNWPTRADAANAATNALPQQLRNQIRQAAGNQFRASESAEALRLAAAAVANNVL